MTLDEFMDKVPWHDMHEVLPRSWPGGRFIRHRDTGCCPIVVVAEQPAMANQNPEWYSKMLGLSHEDTRRIVLASDGTDGDLRTEMMKRMRRARTRSMLKWIRTNAKKVPS